jgi:hypothetical protein
VNWRTDRCFRFSHSKFRHPVANPSRALPKIPATTRASTENFRTTRT